MEEGRGDVTQSKAEAARGCMASPALPPMNDGAGDFEGGKEGNGDLEPPTIKRGVAVVQRSLARSLGVTGSVIPHGVGYELNLEEVPLTLVDCRDLKSDIWSCLESGSG